ncbi:prolipoprotein diacylglyceryl transferase [Sorangium cellulosum]|uniref:Phosphatidylglycerol--prolipoprotein diacylglyceryl transferase n=1 Tax=Sorangium cellulosum TaxID=56 RepID=A0A150QU05_SORCE|nr:prolipoprotein diacylglyceryl transferase family protein [Sorangium cellulosum]KYF71440.1 prolipoprotein diacylglyceryl transferase [Sorangium cellulosum]
MHPILFRVPLPVWTVPLLWVFLIAAGIAFAGAIGLFLAKNKPAAAAAGIAGVALAALASQFKGQTYTLGPLPIYSYGVMLGLSLVVGWYLTLGLAERDGLPKETMANCYVVTALAAVVGSRVLYILTNLDEFDSLGAMFDIRRGGLVAYGGFLGGFIGSYLFLRSHRIPLLPWADVAVPSLASGLMITRIGCYLFGCDFGRPLGETAPAWLKKLGTFPHWPEGTLDHGSGSPAWVQHVKERGLDPTAEASLAVHPTQIYEALVGAGLLTLLLLARRRQKFRGEIFLLFTFSYGVCRYLLELLRDDAERGSIPPSLPEHVLLPAGLVIFAVGYTIGFSHVIRDNVVRKVTQALAFVPAIALYVVLKPETFGASATIQYSTSQAVALATGLAASIAFAIYYKAALDHPEQAMALNLPDSPGAAADRAADDDEDEDDDDEPGDDEDEDDKAGEKRSSPAKASDKRSRAKRGSAKDEGQATARERGAAAEAPDTTGEA